jgi:general secretion pathway protein F
MGQFQYRATDTQGKIVEGTIEAAEVGVVVARLHDRGLIPLRIGEGVEAARAAWRLPGGLPSLSLGRRGVSTRELLVLTQELSTLLAAGLPLDRSLASLAELSENPVLRTAVTEVLHAVQGGKSLAEALAQHPKVFPALYVNMVRAGEIGGFLDQVLQRLAEYLERAQTLRDDLRSALTYPLLLTGVMGFSMVFLLTYVLPRFTDLFAGSGRALPLPTQLLLGVSALLTDYWWALLLGTAAAVLGVRYYIATPRGRFVWDQWRLRILVLGDLMRKVEVAGLARTLGTLLRSGVPMLQALGIVREVIGNQVIARAITEVEVGAREGAGIAAPLGRTGVLPSLALQMITVGEETGRLDEMLIAVAEHLDKEVRNRIKRLVSLLEPVLILVTGLGIGFVVVSMLMAIFSVYDLPL